MSNEIEHRPERFCGGDSLRRGAISSVCTFTFTFTLTFTGVLGEREGWLPQTDRASAFVSQKGYLHVR